MQIAHNARATLLRQRSRLQLEIGRIDAELADLEESKPDIYGSRPPYPAPPGETHRTMRDKGPEFVAAGFADRLGGKRGRSVFYTMTPEQHRAYLASKREQPTPKPAAVVSIDAWIASANYRATRGAR